MKRKLDKEREREFENLLFSSFRQFNVLQIKLLCFNCLTKKLISETLCVAILGKRICEPFVFFIKTIKYSTNKTYTF
jgi:hypothetical protein